MKDSIVDIIIPVHERADWLRVCVTALDQFTSIPHKIVIVDNASRSEQMMEFLDQLSQREDTEVLRLLENRSFSNAVNAGVGHSTSPHVVILNSDVIVTPGWLEMMLQELNAPGVGGVGAQSNAISGPQADPSMAGPNPPCEPGFLCFQCVIFRRSVMTKIGPLDEKTFDGFSSEDLDYSFRLRAAGLKLRVARSFVFHGGSQTLAHVVGSQEKRAANDAKYMGRLVQKWGEGHVVKAVSFKPKVMVASFSAEEWTRVQFLRDLLALKKGSGVAGQEYGFNYIHMERLTIHLARQMVADVVTKNDFTHVLMIDDDMVFPPDTLPRLLRHQVDVVSALAYQRNFPFGPCAFKLAEDNKHVNAIEGLEGRGLTEVSATGLACTLIRVDVFNKLREKGTKKFFGHFDELGEDIYFCEKVREAGLKIHVDGDLVIGHIGAGRVVDQKFREAFKAGKFPELRQ